MKTRYIVIFILATLAPSLTLMGAQRTLTPAQIIEQKQAEVDRLSPLVDADFQTTQELRRQLQNTTCPAETVILNALLTTYQTACQTAQADLVAKAEELAYLRRTDAYHSQERTPHSPLQSHIVLGHTHNPIDINTICDRFRAALARLDVRVNYDLSVLEDQHALVDQNNAENHENRENGHLFLNRTQERLMAKYARDKEELISAFQAALPS